MREVNSSAVYQSRDMARRFEGNAAELWVRTAQDLPSDVMEFALNASLETLATNVNLHT